VDIVGVGKKAADLEVVNRVPAQKVKQKLYMPITKYGW
jgi:hypothetical protein